MNTDEIYTYILTSFEGKSFENIMLNKREGDLSSSFTTDVREKIVEAMNTDKYKEVILKLARSFMTNLAKGTKTSSFSKEECNEIFEIYHKLIENIANYDLSYEKIAREHYTNVRNFITEYTSNDNTKKKNSSYSPEFILDVLKVDKNKLKGNVLDIGCGKNGELVKYLCSKGINAHGVDMECEDSDILEQEDWLYKEYPEKEYDLITSNLAFTKKFNEANLEENNDEECVAYATTYMKILNSLKVGGTFNYVPAVTFIEELLPEDKFEVRNTFIDDSVMRTEIKRLK